MKGAAVRPTGGVFVAFAALGSVALASAVLLARVPPLTAPRGPRGNRRRMVSAARKLNRAAGTIATSVFIDSAVEHYRGAFHNKAMFTPVLVSALTVASSLHGHRDLASRARRARDVVYGLAGLTGLAGTAFHAYNVGKRTGGLCWQNLFRGAPVGAPAAMALAGMTGFLAERVRHASGRTAAQVWGLPPGRVVAALTAVGLCGTAAEAGLLHFRGAFHNPAMLLPVTVPPAAAALLATMAARPAERPLPFTRWWLRVTALLGVVGAGFHAIGVARCMGGWGNWRQNLQVGPPLPAPPAFSGLALAGLAALDLLEQEDAVE